MKSILIIEDNLYQIVFTPENDHEKEVLNLIDEQKVEATMKVGNFNECQGGWVRYCPSHMGWSDNKKQIDSLMLVLKRKEESK